MKLPCAYWVPLRDMQHNLNVIKTDTLVIKSDFAFIWGTFLPCWPNRRRRACSSRKWESSSWRISHRAKPTSRIAATVGTTSDQRVALNSSCNLSWERPPQVRHCNTVSPVHRVIRSYITQTFNKE
jgi:hypothetical protein